MNGNIHRLFVRCPQRVVFLLAVLLALWGGALTRESVSLSSLKWMNVYHISDFESFHQVLPYLRDLRTGIPPLLSLLEIVAYLAFGSLASVTIFAYRIGIVSIFILAFLAFSRSVLGTVCSFLFSAVFLWAFVVLHPLNPQIYDVFFPLFILLYIGCLQIALKSARENRITNASVLFLLAGVFLSAAELTRPFVLLMLPVLLLFSLAALWSLPKRFLLLFLVPLGIFSGGWHAKLYFLNGGQILWTNHSGYNMANAWKPFIKIPTGQPEAANVNAEKTVYKGEYIKRWDNINTEIHFQNNKLVRHEIFKFVREHPVRSLVHILKRVMILVWPQVSVGESEPDHAILGWYRLCFRLALLSAAANALLLGYLVVSRRRLSYLGTAESLLMATTWLSIFFLAIGEKGEEVRFALSLAPFLAALPSCLGMAANANHDYCSYGSSTPSSRRPRIAGM